MGSSRFPGKILKPFYNGRTLLDTILFTLHKIDNIKIIVATSVDSNNDQLEHYLKEKNELFYRGSENDVLERFINAAEANNIDGIIRICSDNPFIDYEGILRLIEAADNSYIDYIGFRINDKPSILTHFGFWGEFVTLAALKKVYETTDKGTPAHEHVTYHVYTHPEEYNCKWLKVPSFLQGRNDIRLTVDTEIDYQNTIKVYTDLMNLYGDIHLKAVVEYLDSHNDIKTSMLSSININKK